MAWLIIVKTEEKREPGEFPVGGVNECADEEEGGVESGILQPERCGLGT